MFALLLYVMSYFGKIYRWNKYACAKIVLLVIEVLQRLEFLEHRPPSIDSLCLGSGIGKMKLVMYFPTKWGTSWAPQNLQPITG